MGNHYQWTGSLSQTRKLVPRFGYHDLLLQVFYHTKHGDGDVDLLKDRDCVRSPKH